MTGLQLRDQLARAGTAVQRRLAATTRGSDRLSAAVTLARTARRVAAGDPAVVRPLVHRPAELRELLSAVLLADAAGEPVDPTELGRLRSLAVRSRIRDVDGTSIVALRTLAERFGDAGARAWLAPALAEAGRFREAVEQPPTFGRGRPRDRHYPILVSALAMLGRQDEARRRMAALEDRRPSLRQDFVQIWGDDPLARAYRRLVEVSPARHGALPVFQHLPFCAGSSMQFSLQLVVGWATTAQIGRRCGLPEIADLESLPPERIEELMMVHQHHPYPLELPGRRLSHFTVLRDPVSQLRSGFYKRGARATVVTTRDTSSQTFEQHAAYTLSAGLTNMLTRMIISTHPELRADYRRHYDSRARYAPIDNEEDMYWLRATRRFGDERLLRMARETLTEDYCVVGTMSHLVASHLACTAAVGVPVAHTLGHRGKSGQPPRAEDGPTERRLREANAVDQQLFDHYTERFAREHADLISALNHHDSPNRHENPDQRNDVTGSATADPTSSPAAPAPARTYR